MRYSRFRQQMEGTSAPRIKRRPKKPKVVDPPMDMQGMFPMNLPSGTSTTGSVDPSFRNNPFIKCEPGMQGNSVQSHPPYDSHSMAENNMHGQYYVPRQFTPIQFQPGANMQPGLLSSTPARPSPFMNPYQHEMIPSSYPYSSAGVRPGFDMRDIGVQFACSNPPPSITWGRQVSSSLGDPVIKSEELQQDTSALMWGSPPSFQQDITTASSGDQHPNSFPANLEPQSSFPPAFPTLASMDRDQNPPAFNWNQSAVPRQKSPIIKSEEKPQSSTTINWEPVLPPQDPPVSQNEEHPQSSEKATWASISPASFPQTNGQLRGTELRGKETTIWDSTSSSPGYISPQISFTETEIQQPSNALVLWQPPNSSRQLYQ